MKHEEALRWINQISYHATTSPQLQQRVSEAVRKRRSRIERERALSEEEHSELLTRASMIKDAHRRLVGELEAFVSATYRHDKDR